MHLEHRSISVVFLMALAAAFTFPILFPFLHMTYFGPCCILFIYQKPLTRCLWDVFACGLILDALSDHSHLGLHAAAYCIAAAILYPQRRHFFADAWTTLPLMTALFAVVVTLV